MNNDVEKEIQELTDMMNYLFTKCDELPVALQLRLLTELLSFGEKLKPLYIAALILRGE